MSKAFPDDIDLGGLVPALLDFERMPGRYRLALREPSLLFEQSLAVMQLAAGRQLKGMAPLGEGREARAAHTAAQKAARFFVRVVLLRASADHYTLLGLKPNFEPEALRDHYRLMIRLTHPDFSAPGTEWPADAASRINIARIVLGSVVQRAQYDAGLNAAASAAPQGKPTAASAPAPASPLATPHRAPPRPAQAAPKRSFGSFGSFEDRQRTTRRRRKIAIATSGALACALLLWLATPSGNGGSLMAQRAQPAAKPSSVGDNTRALVDKLMAPSGQPPVQPGAAPGVVPVATSTGNSAAGAVAALAVQPLGVAQAAPASPLRASGGDPLDQSGGSDSAPLVLRAVGAISMPAPERSMVAPEANLPAWPARDGASAQASNKAGRNASGNISGHISGNISTNDRAGNETNTTAKPTALPMAAVAVTAAGEFAEPPLTMDRVQPKLALLLGGLESGKGENVTRWLDGNWRDHPAANTFVKNYTQLVAGQRVVQLGQVRLRSRAAAEQFVVDGVVELYVQDSSAVQHVKRLQVSAYFVPKDGQAMLTQVVLNRP